MAGKENPSTQEKSEQVESYDRLIARATEWVITTVAVVVLVSVILLIIEFFIISPASNDPERSALIALLGLYPLFIFNCMVLLNLRMRARRHFRESYALSALSALVFGGLILIVTMYSWFVPWEMYTSVGSLLANQKVNQPIFSGVNIALLIVLYLVFLQLLTHIYERWPGRTSRAQFERDQISSGRPNLSNLFGEAVFELGRRVRRGPALAEYIEPQQQFELQLPTEPIVSLAWADQARDLVCLVSASYSFKRRQRTLNLEELDERSVDAGIYSTVQQSELESDWHDLQKIWIGRNDRTKKIVALIPAQNTANLTRLTEQISYASGIAEQQGQSFEEVIIALHDGKTPPFISTNEEIKIPVRVETEHSLLEQTINLDDYRSIIEKRVCRLLPNTGLTLKDIYIPMRGVIEGEAAPIDVESYIQKWLAEPGRRHLALLGSYGQGKSTVALMLTYHLLMAYHDIPPRIPILIELRGRNLQNLKPYALLGQWAGHYGLDGRALVQLHDAGRLLLIFEGFDEMAYLADIEMRMSYFRALWEFARYPNAKILISGRPNLFESPGELEQALNLRKAFGAGAYCEPLYLERLLRSEIEAALRSHPVHIRDAICQLANANKSFYDIVSRPSLLQLVAAIWDEPEMKAVSTAPTSADVMRAFVHSTHRRQTEKEEDGGKFMKLTEAERVYFMGGVALSMAVKGETNIDAQRLSALTDQLRIAMPDAVSEQASLIGGKQTPLRLRIKNQRTGEDDPALIARVKTEVRTSSLLESEADAPGILKFGHKSFLEYIVAEEISRAIVEPHSIRSRTLLKISEADVTSILEQPESLDFLAELLVSRVGGANIDINRISTASDADQLIVGRKILQSMIKKPKIIFLRRPLIFTLLFYRKILSLLIKSINIISIIFPIIALVILFIKPSILISSSPTQSSSLGSKLMEIIFIALIIAPFFYISILLFKIEKRVMLWMRICRKIGLRDHVFYSETGTSILFWLRNKPFPFLQENRSQSTSRNKMTP